MKKLYLAVAAAGLCALSTTALASDKASATAWSGIADSIARIVKGPNVRSALTSVSGSVSALASVLTGDSERTRPGAHDPQQRYGEAQQTAAACPWCPDPPCD